MMYKKHIFAIFFTVANCFSITTASWWNSKQPELKLFEKPAFFQHGEYKNGTYTQITFDTHSLACATFAGVAARTLVSLAQCGNKFENFKSSVLRPGLVKSALFWLPALFAYRYSLSIKENNELQYKLKNPAVADDTDSKD